MMQTQQDIVVVGGGLAGFACAFQAAAAGRQVLLVERRPALGWESTWAGQIDFRDADSPVARQILSLLESVGGYRPPLVDGPILEMALDRLAREVGLRLLLHAYPVRLVHDGERALGVVLGSRSGEHGIQANVIVDATEEGLLWEQTGVPVERRETVPGTQVFFMNHAEVPLDQPLDLGDGVWVLPSLWSGEVRVAYAIPENTPLAGRRPLVEVIRRVREEVNPLREALVSHVANEPFPQEAMLRLESPSPVHPRLRNFFAAGIWASREPNTPGGRIRVGEEAAGHALRCPPEENQTLEPLAGSVFSPPEAEADVLVIGGGTGGTIAAIVAGREGLRTTLIEASPTLGGMGTGGAIHSYCAGLSGGIQDEVDERVRELTPVFAGKWRVVGFEPEAKKWVLQRMAEEAGVAIQLNTVVTGVILQGGQVQTAPPEPGTAVATRQEASQEPLQQIAGVLAATPTGIAAYGAKVFIDSTGDGDVAAMAGAPFIIGREKDNLTHAFSQAAGALDPKNGSLRFFNFDAGYVDPTDVEDMTRARRLGIQLYWRDRFTEENRLLYIAPLVGLRQGRQILGEYQLTLADEIAGRRFDDAVSFMQAFYDNHGFDYENESAEAALWVWALGNWNKRIGCEIPYRCLLPRRVDGLLLACRALSMTYDAHAAFRMQKDIQRIGEVAALAAAQAIRKGVSVREVNVAELQPILKERGLLSDQYRPKPAIAEVPLRQLPSPASLDSTQAKEVVWLATLRGKEGVPVLKEALQSEDPEVRFKAAAALALQGHREGLPELLRCVEQRDTTVPEGNKQVPRWQSAITFLGMVGDPDTFPVLVDVLRDSQASLDALLAAVRALGNLGDRRAIRPLHELLQREDLPTQRPLQVSTGGIQPAVEDARWQIDLTTAESLAKLGDSGDSVRRIAEPYLDDARAYVRRYARNVLQISPI